MTFTFNYICDHSVLEPVLYSASFFKNDKFVCQSQVSFISSFYCIKGEQDLSIKGLHALHVATKAEEIKSENVSHLPKSDL